MASEESNAPTRNQFELANRAFETFTLDERTRALQEFAKLEYPDVRDRFFQAVYLVIIEIVQQRQVR